jgi:hypothetical protein
MGFVFEEGQMTWKGRLAGPIACIATHGEGEDRETQAFLEREIARIMIGRRLRAVVYRRKGEDCVFARDGAAVSWTGLAQGAGPAGPGVEVFEDGMLHAPDWAETYGYDRRRRVRLWGRRDEATGTIVWADAG